MMTAKVMEVGEKVIGVDSDGGVVEIHGIVAGELKVGDLVEGHLLNDDENPDNFYMDAVNVLPPNPEEEFDESAYLLFKNGNKE